MATQGSPLSIFQTVPTTGNRRRTVRQKVHSPAYASFDGIGGGMVLDLTEITDIGEAGLSLHSPAILTPNRALNLVLDLSETKTYINTTGYVVWTDQSGRAGIRFSKMPDITRLQLQRWLFFNAMAGAAKAQERPQSEHTSDEIQSPHVEADIPLDTRSLGILARPGSQAEPAALVADAPTLNLIQEQVDLLGSDTFAALQLVAERSQAMTRAAGAAIALSEGTEMVCRASSGDAPPVGARFHVGSGFSGECVRTGRLQRCDDAETDPIVDQESCRQLGIRSMVASPILVHDNVVGLLEVFSPDPYAFEESDAAALRRLSDIVARVSEKQSERIEALAALATTPHAEPLVFGERKNFLRSKTTVIIGSSTVLVLAALIYLGFIFAQRPVTQPTNNSPVPSNVSKAPEPQTTTLESLQNIALKGDPVAQFALGARYAQGDGVKQDYTEASHWFSQAADQGHVVAQATLGAYYWAGRGVPQDLVKAYFWSSLARAGGDEASKYRVAALTSHMTQAQVAAAQQQANEWLRSRDGTNRASR